MVRKYHVRFAPAIREGRGADLKVCTPQEIRARQMGDRGGIRLVEVRVQPVSAPTAASAGRAARTPKPTAASPLEPSVARPNLLGAQAQRTALVAAFDFVAAVFGVGGSGRAAIPVPAESQSGDRVKHHAADGSV
jgi:hypothetical protein